MVAPQWPDIYTAHFFLDRHHQLFPRCKLLLHKLFDRLSVNHLCCWYHARFLVSEFLVCPNVTLVGLRLPSLQAALFKTRGPVAHSTRSTTLCTASSISCAFLRSRVCSV